VVDHFPSGRAPDHDDSRCVGRLGGASPQQIVFAPARQRCGCFERRARLFVAAELMEQVASNAR